MDIKTKLKNWSKNELVEELLFALKYIRKLLEITYIELSLLIIDKWVLWYFLNIIIFAFIYCNFLSVENFQYNCELTDEICSDLLKEFSYVDWLYFSAVTISTLGYGDIVPASNFTRILVSIESVGGIFLLGLFLNSAALKAFDINNWGRFINTYSSAFTTIYSLQGALFSVLKISGNTKGEVNDMDFTQAQDSIDLIKFGEAITPFKKDVLDKSKYIIITRLVLASFDDFNRLSSFHELSDIGARTSFDSVIRTLGILVAHEQRAVSSIRSMPTLFYHLGRLDYIVQHEKAKRLELIHKKLYNICKLIVCVLKKRMRINNIKV